MSTSEESKVRNRRRVTPNNILVFILSFVLVFTGSVVAFSTNHKVAKLDSSTPAGVVQFYLTAMISGERDKAASMLSTGSKCTIEDIDRAYVASDSRVYLSSTKISGDKATVNVKVGTPSGDPFSDYYTETHTYRLIRSESSWRLLGIPWPVYDCGILKK